MTGSERPRARSTSWTSVAPRLALVLFVSLPQCVSASVPDPRDAARAYADAATRGDVDALYGMMDRSSRLARSRNDVEKLVDDERSELAELAGELQRPEVRIQATARLRYADGEEAALELRNGGYGVTAAGALPGGAHTPEEALDQLRRVLARRSYAALIRVLSPSTRAAIENDLRALVDGLSEPGALPVQVNGDAAQVPIPGGHLVRLKRDAGVWRVEDFD